MALEKTSSQISCVCKAKNPAPTLLYVDSELNVSVHRIRKSALFLAHWPIRLRYRFTSNIGNISQSDSLALPMPGISGDTAAAQARNFAF